MNSPITDNNKKQRGVLVKDDRWLKVMMLIADDCFTSASETNHVLLLCYHQTY